MTWTFVQFYPLLTERTFCQQLCESSTCGGYVLLDATRVNGYIQFDVSVFEKLEADAKSQKNAACFNCNIKYSISLFRSDWVQWVHRDSELDDRTLALHSSFYLADTWIQSESVLARTHFVKVRQVVIIPLLHHRSEAQRLETEWIKW